MRRNNYWVLILITVVAIIARVYGSDLEPLSPEQKASVLLSISAGVLSVVGLYFLVKELFDEKLAIISSFLLAVSFWHILISKLGAKDIFTSFALIFAFYFIWHGIRRGHIFDFFLAGLAGGAGFYTGKGYFAVLIVALLVFWNYRDYVKKDFPLSKYEQTKTQILGGFSLLVVTVVATAIPVGFYIWQNPEFILSADNSIFSSESPLVQLSKNFAWITDKILLVNFGNTNLISWPLSIFFAIGFIKEFIHWLKRKHGHFSVVHTLLFSWLFVMLIPSLFSADTPSSLNLGIILPPILIISAKGLWWTINGLNRWDHLTYPRHHKHWWGLDAGPFLALIALMVSIALLEFS